MGVLDDHGLDVPLLTAGTGRTVLVLHGGGGPGTVVPLATALSATAPTDEPALRTVVPTHPGYDGTRRPQHVRTVADLADLYLRWAEEEDLHDVVVVGSSIGGWIALEMALRDDAHRLRGLVLVDSVGIAVPGEPVRDVFGLDAAGLATYAWHDGARFLPDPATLTDAQRGAQAANGAATRAYAGDPYMHDPGLAARLGGVDVPTLVVWGASDRIATPAYGRALAAALPDARFTLVPEAGHLPHLERPAETLAAVESFLSTLPLTTRA